MNRGCLRLALATAGCALLFGPDANAQKAGAQARFAAPKRIQASEAFLGEGRYYPSPVLHDLDGDKRPDLIVGDLMGRVTFARRTADAETLQFAAETEVKGADGKPLKFHNW